MSEHPGFLYLIHFAEPLGDPERPRMHASHYLGWAKDSDSLDQRINDHIWGRGAAITRAAFKRGIKMYVAKVWEGDRNEERRLKNNGNHARRCCFCAVPRTTVA